MVDMGDGKKMKTIILKNTDQMKPVDMIGEGQYFDDRGILYMKISTKQFPHHSINGGEKRKCACVAVEYGSTFLMDYDVNVEAVHHETFS